MITAKDLKNLEIERNVLIAELAAYLPQWDDRATVLMRLVAAHHAQQWCPLRNRPVIRGDESSG